MNFLDSKITSKIEKDIDFQLNRVFSNLYWVYPYRYGEYYKSFEEFNFVRQMLKDNQLKIRKTSNLTIIYNEYVRDKKILDEYFKSHPDLFR